MKQEVVHLEIKEIINNMTDAEALDFSTLLISIKNGDNKKSIGPLLHTNNQKKLYSLLNTDSTLYDYIISSINSKIMNAASEKKVSLDKKSTLKNQVGLLDYSCLVYTVLPSISSKEMVIGRDYELKNLVKLVSKENAILISGFSGIGKTMLAQSLFYRIAQKFDAVAWVTYNHNLKESILASFELGRDIRDPEERWREISTLKYDGMKKLFVIDNVSFSKTHNVQNADELFALSMWQNTTVIVTSRQTELHGFTTYHIGLLNLEDCVRLFYNYYNRKRSPQDEEIVRNIIQLANNHTLSIVLLAKGANSADNLSQYYQSLLDCRFSIPSSIEINKTRNNATTVIAEHLRVLFDMKTHTQTEMDLLWVFAVLPIDAELTRKETRYWFGIDLNNCEQLISDGWLSRQRGRYSMHPLIRHIIRLNTIPKETAETFLHFIEDDRNGFFREDEFYTELIRRLEIAETILDAVCKEMKPIQLSNILNNMGGACLQLARYEDAEDYYKKSLEIKEAELGRDHLSTAKTYSNLAVVYQAMGDLHKALEYNEKACAICETWLGKGHPDTAQTYNNLAEVYQDLGDLSKALEYHILALSIYESKLGEAHPNTAISYNNLASNYYAMGDLQKAKEYHEKALAIRQAKLEKQHPSIAQSYNNLALVYQGMGDLPKALEYFEKALEIIKRVMGDEHPQVASTFNNLALVYQDLGDLPKAMECYKKSLSISEAKLGKEHPDTAMSYNNLASLYFALGQYPVAIEYLLQAIRVFLRKLGPRHPYSKGTYTGLSVSYLALHGENESFLPWLRGQFNAEENRALDEMLKE